MTALIMFYCKQWHTTHCFYCRFS